jgi:steroid 5-alpha reductase family enzyme
VRRGAEVNQDEDEVEMDAASIALIGGAGTAALMLGLWIVQRRTGNAGIVDVGWAAAVGSMAILSAVAGAGDPARRLVLGTMGGLWGLRLATHLLVDRVLGKPEEGRYRELRRHWQQHLQWKLLGFFELQAVAVVLLSLPFLLGTANPSPFPGVGDLLAIALFATGWLGEWTADRQLRAFKADPASSGRTCRRGLWRYSRHPNYFFEWVIWCSFALGASGAPAGWLAWVAPAIMLVLLVWVTGIPPTEQQALRSRGDDYRRYQRETSPFVPWFPRRANP